MALVYGVGINDVRNNSESNTIYYRTWAAMLYRAYSKKHKFDHPTYENCSVCEEWKYYSNFKAWMQTQDWEGKALDKDLLVLDNKIYSPETCVFLDQNINLFIVNPNHNRVNSLIGSYFDERDGSYFTSVCNPFTKKSEQYGPYSSEYAAHNAWKKRKSQIANMIADTQTDPRISNALRSRYDYVDCKLRKRDYLFDEVLRLLEAERDYDLYAESCLTDFPDVTNDPIRTFKTEYAFESLTNSRNGYKKWPAD